MPGKNGDTRAARFHLAGGFFDSWCERAEREKWRRNPPTTLLPKPISAARQKGKGVRLLLKLRVPKWSTASKQNVHIYIECVCVHPRRRRITTALLATDASGFFRPAHGRVYFLVSGNAALVARGAITITSRWFRRAPSAYAGPLNVGDERIA